MAKSTFIDNKITLLLLLSAGLIFSLSLDLYRTAPESIANPGLMIVAVVAFIMALITLFMWGTEDWLLIMFYFSLALAIVCGLLYYHAYFPAFSAVCLYYCLYNVFISIVFLSIFAFRYYCILDLITDLFFFLR